MTPSTDRAHTPPALLNISGVLPHLAVKAEHHPKRTETGIGALMPWAKPAGWGGPWWETAVENGTTSDPYLMTGFEHKCLHVRHDGGEGTHVTLQVDFMGQGQWMDYLSLAVDDGYAFHVFPTGFSAHWVRLVSHRAGLATAQFVYT